MEGGVWPLPESLLGLLHQWEVWIHPGLPLGTWVTTSIAWSSKAWSLPPLFLGWVPAVLLACCPGSLRSAGKVCDLQPLTGRSAGQAEGRRRRSSHVQGLRCVPEASHWAVVTRSPWRQGRPQLLGERAESRRGGSAQVVAGGAGCVVCLSRLPWPCLGKARLRHAGSGPESQGPGQGQSPWWGWGPWLWQRHQAPKPVAECPAWPSGLSRGLGGRGSGATSPIWPPS